MKMYSPQKFRPFAWLSSLLRSMAYLLRHWLLLSIAVLMISPIGPHLLVWYTYRDYGGYRVYNDCLYLGGGGLMEFDNWGDCPVMIILDRREKH